MPQFIIVLTARGDTWTHLGEPEQQRLLAQYDAWAARLRDEGVYRHGSATGRAEVVAADGAATPATGERITGLFTIEVADLERAVAFASDCPGHSHGETVTVYELT